MFCNLADLLRAYKNAPSTMRDVTRKMLACIDSDDATDTECTMAIHTILDALNVRTVRQISDRSANSDSKK